MTMQYEGKEQLLASLLEREGIAVSESSAIQPSGCSSDLPLSFAQERFWFLNQLEGGAHYNDHLAFRLRGNLNAEALERSLNEIVNRHQTLRTTIVMVEGNPRQQVAEHRPINLQRFDVSDLSIDHRESEALRQATDLLKKPFALDQSPAFRTALWRLGADDHLFLLCVNQIINDGWSLKIFTNELVTLYRSFIAGQKAELSELPIQYADFAVWQREQFDNAGMASQMTYWKKQLSGELPVLELPSDHPRASVKTFRGARHYILLPDTLLDSLKLLAQREKATLFMVLLAAFKTLIYRYAGQEDISIGFPIANRDRIETEQLIGVFINPLVLRSDLSGQPTFRELLARVREMALDAYANQHLPFEKLVEALHPSRDISHPPLFQVLFDYNNVPMPKMELPNLTATRVDLDAGTAKFDLSLELTETANEIRGFFEYSTDLFTADRIDRMSEHFERLLEGIADDPNQKISRLPLMSEKELQTVLIDWNDTAEAHREDLSIHGRFEAQVEETPDRRSVIFDGKSQTYGELNRYANKLAHFMIGSGIKPGSRIGICVERSPEMIGCLLGALKAGCQYVPLDPNYPKKRLEFMIEDADISLLLTKSDLLERLPKCSSQVFEVDTGFDLLDSQSEENPCLAVAGDGAAYVIYTSGSTGRPKGVIGTHRGAINRFEWMWKKYGFAPDEVCCQKTSLSFVDSVWEIFGPLLQGIPSVIIPDEITREPDRFIETLAANAVTRLVAVPSLLEMLLTGNEDLGKKLPALKYCVSSGEALSADLCRRFQEALPGTVLLNLYGSSEASADSTYYEVTPNDKHAMTMAPIGRPVSNTQVYILDRHCLPVPIGIPGELHIGGAGLAAGYINRSDLTSQRFIKNPFTADSRDTRLYKAGDIARFRQDGNIEYLGRVDDQVKIRGMRVELGEIEAALRQHDDITQAAVVVSENVHGNINLVAYVVTNNQSLVDTGLRVFLRRNLPEHMLPSFLIFVDALPATPSGKLDRRALRESEEFRVTPNREISDPRDDIERQLTTIWKNVLGLESISITDNFFDLGGHSLLAVKLFYEIEQVIGRKLALATLFQAPTIEQLASVIRDDRSEECEPSIVAIQKNGKKPPFFCIHAAGGNVLFYRDLARRLGQDQPFYGIQARRIGGRQVAHSDVEEMAAFYIKELIVVQPNGPYFLGGSSFGGAVAFEMAHQLKALGKEVAFVALFDTNGPGYPCYLPGTTLLKSRAYDLARRLEQQWDNMRLLRSGTRWNYVVHKAGKIRHKLWRSRRKYKDIAHTHGLLLVFRMLWDSVLGRSRRTPYASTADIPDDYRKTEGNIRTAYESYVPRFYDGHVTLFRASKQELGIIDDPNLGWGELIADLEVYEIEGHHGSIVIEPHVQFLKPRLRRCLEKAQNGHHPMTEKAPNRMSERYFAQTG
jgi:amino acid adenylation domain-containing protein